MIVHVPATGVDNDISRTVSLQADSLRNVIGIKIAFNGMTRTICFHV